MGRRRKKDFQVWNLVQGIAGLLLLAMILPEGRQVAKALGTFALWGVGLGLGGALSFLLYRSLTRTRSEELNFECRVIDMDAPAQKPPLQPRTDLGTYVSIPEEQPPAPKPDTTANLIERLRSIDWFQFEKLVALVYQKLGYCVLRKGGANPDGGIDLVIEKGGEQWAVQCKQWKTWNVGVKAVREFLGALTDAGIQKGIFMTLRGYTGEAKHLAEKHGIKIINESDLAMLLNMTDARLDPEVMDLLQDTRKFCPKCEREMVLRTSSKGLQPGSKFWGCTAYPRCRVTLPYNPE